MARRIAVVDNRQLALFGAVAAAQETPASSANATPPNAGAVGAGDNGVAPPLFRHPRGQREVLLDGHAVVYAFKRVRRKSIGFVIGPDGLAVSAPAWVGLAAVDAALHAKARWILRKLADQRERTARAQSARFDWRDGGEISFLGRSVTIVLDAGTGPAGMALLDAGEPARLRIGLPRDAGAQQVRDAVQSWLQRQARRLFEERCAHFAPLLGVRLRRLALSSAQTRWGSASADGSIRLNWRLVHFALPTIDYVVVHELAHLREMNHSARFWNVVRSVVPDYEQARGALKSELLPHLD
ncbi:MAG: SprT family zinc-dependent metalloprotease [Burkholderiaceae bacterium]